MRLYVWESEFLKDWSSGMAVACAETVEEARGLVLAAAVGDFCEQEKMGRDLARDPDRVLDLPAAVYCWGGS